MSYDLDLIKRIRQFDDPAMRNEYYPCDPEMTAEQLWLLSQMLNLGDTVLQIKEVFVLIPPPFMSGEIKQRIPQYLGGGYWAVRDRKFDERWIVATNDSGEWETLCDLDDVCTCKFPHVGDLEEDIGCIAERLHGYNSSVYGRYYYSDNGEADLKEGKCTFCCNEITSAIEKRVYELVDAAHLATLLDKQ
jgi:hypothetical protein